MGSISRQVAELNGYASGVATSPRRRVLLDISHTTHELLFAHDLTFVEAAHLYFVLALQTEGEASLDEPHGLFQRHIRRGSH